MKEVELAFKSFAEGLRIFAKSLEVLADQISVMGGVKSKAPTKPAKTRAPKKEPAVSPKKAASKPAPSKAKKPAPASPKKSAKTSVETVYNIIARSKKGVSSVQIQEKTGYNAKKVANVVYKLKNRNQIKAVKKGVYVKK